MGELKRRIITLLSDFGTKDHFVGCMKGAILEINPNVDLIDITHEVPAHDILGGAFTLRSYYNYFPHRTIHLAIVDPGVGTRRRPLIVSTENYTFVSPDNGLLSFIYETEVVSRVVHISEEHFFRKPVSNTFHGRDIFAPVAAWLSREIEVSKFGSEITDYLKLSTPKVRAVNPKMLNGVVLHVDKFGNVITNFTEKEIPRVAGVPQLAKFLIAREEVTDVKNSYEEGEPGEIFAILGSSGFYEIATPRGSAASILGIDRGTEVGALLK